jgi:hypothetical protein
MDKDAEIERLKAALETSRTAHKRDVTEFRKLLARAADALQDWVGTPGISTDTFGRTHRELIGELREAAK